MSFLSIDQRKAALGQMDAFIELQASDERLLMKKLDAVRELKALHVSARESVRRATEGEMSAADLQTVDDISRSRLMYGISHYPVKIGSAEKVVVHGRFP